MSLYFEIFNRNHLSPSVIYRQLMVLRIVMELPSFYQSRRKDRKRPDVTRQPVHAKGLLREVQAAEEGVEAGVGIV